ncbi:MAG TPA: sugar phosphate isomerase/epimerase family protein [Gemmatimonadales bacterium]|nr:sugar phosphate isomerase/epimerase family protein [Gemmatimonadales bacterium]
MADLTRRELLQGSGGLLAAAALRSAAGQPAPLPRGPAAPPRLKQSVSRWPYSSIPLAEFCKQAKSIGLDAIDLLQPDEWPAAADAGLVCSMGYPSARDDFIATGFNDKANHRMLLTELEHTIPLAARAGVPNVITMFGNRRGRSDSEAIANCIEGLSKIKAQAEEQKVTVCVELLNSKVDHKDYQGDRTAFGVEVMNGVNSPRVKLLYDIYHMQIMEGDVIRTIRDNIAHLGHFHTGGVPGRHELDDRQELNWRAIALAIADLGFAGYFAHEFVPTGPPLASLRQAVELCKV